MRFDQSIGIDYSGAATAESRSKTLQIYAATGGPPERTIAVPEEGKTHWNWCRKEIAEYLVDMARKNATFIAGIDHAFSFPESYFERYDLTSWDEFLSDFVEHWPTHRPGIYVDFIRDEGATRLGWPTEFRLCERWTSSAKSVFDFTPGPGIVAKSTHAGIPWLSHIREEFGDRVHFWPFDGWEIPEGKSAIVEVYPSIFSARYPCADRTADQQDAYATARWLKEIGDREFLERCLNPPLTDEEQQTARLEGWILGIA